MGTELPANADVAMSHSPKGVSSGVYLLGGGNRGFNGSRSTGFQFGMGVPYMCKGSIE